ncbi:MAG: hypothetical protein VYE64_05380 [Planctomycetota bacterium]|nr:hypothetical protein [Planctomycetota bacterium]
MQPGLNCVQFEKRIQGLLDSRQELATDARLTQHSRECQTCREILASYQSLEDSFSGKISPTCRITLQSINRLTDTVVPRRWPQYAPLAILLLTGLFAGIWFASSTTNLNVQTANRQRPLSEHSHPYHSALPLLSNHQHPLAYQIPDWSESGNQLQKVDNWLKAMNPMLLPAPMVSFYFRYKFDFPTTLNLRSSFQNLYLWLQEQFSPATEQPSNHQNQNRVKIEAT